MYKLQIMLTLGQNHRDLCWWAIAPMSY